MRLHILLDDDLVAEIDRRAGQRKRSEFIAAVLREAIDNERHWDAIEESLGTIDPTGHDWDTDLAGWVREQRSDTKRTG